MLYTIRNEDLMAQVSSSGAQLMSLEERIIRSISGGATHDIGRIEVLQFFHM